MLEGRGHAVYGESGQGKAVYGKPNRPDCVVHLGWYSSAGDKEANLHERCLKETQSLVDMLADCQLVDRPVRLLFASTASVYGNRPNEELNELSTTSPGCAYTKSKLLAETYIRQCLGNYLILRLGSLMGRGVTRDKTDVCVNAFAADAYRKGIIEVWNPDAWKPILHVQDAALIIAEAVAKDKWRGVVNCAAVSLRAGDIAKLVARITGAQVRTVSDRNGLRSTRLDCTLLRHQLPHMYYRTIENAVSEFKDYLPKPGDRNDPTRWKGVTN